MIIKRMSCCKYIIAVLIAIIVWSCRNSAEEDSLAFIPPTFPDVIEVTPTYLNTDFITGSVMELKVKDSVLLRAKFILNRELVGNSNHCISCNTLLAANKAKMF